MWRPTEYEVEFADAAAFNTALHEFADTDVDRLRALMRRMRDPQRHDSNPDYRMLQGRAAKKVKLCELRAHFGPGYRVYVGCREEVLIIAGVGTKRTQNRDIEHASAILGDWDQRQQTPARRE